MFVDELFSLLKFNLSLKVNTLPKSLYEVRIVVKRLGLSYNSIHACYNRCFLFRGEMMTHSQLLEGLKCESQTENNGRVRSWGTLSGSQHYTRVEGRVGAPGWD
jgi:hypothetical protein